MTRSEPLVLAHPAGPRSGRSRVGLVLVVLGGLLGASLAHVWVRLQRIQTGYALSRETREAHRLTETQKRLRIEAVLLKHPARIERIARTRLGMIAPDAAHLHPIRPARAQALPAGTAPRVLARSGARPAHRLAAPPPVRAAEEPR